MKACGRCGRVHDRAAEVRECYNLPLPERSEPPATLVGDRATDKQVEFARRLLARIGRSEDALPKLLESYGKREISTLIDELLLEPVVPLTVKRSAELEDGMYRLDGVIFKVQHAIHGSGRQYAKRLEVVTEAVRDDEGDIVTPGSIRFVYIAGAVARLTPEHRLTMAEAEEFGALYGTCVRCGRTLTKEKSIARAMGPVCAGKL